MGTQKNTNRHREERMTLAYVDNASALTRSLEDREAERVGSLVEGRKRLARRVGCAPGTLRNLRIGRLKRVEGWLFNKLRDLAVSEIEQEIKRLTHELELARACACGSHEGKVQALRAAVAKAQALIDEGAE